jgi:lipopolysaccharide export system permease protein
MNILTKYLVYKYTKTFLIVLFSLELFFLGMDLIQHLQYLPKSANLQLLYIMYKGFFVLSIVLPLSLVFAWIILVINLIKNNEFVAFYSIGVTKEQIIKPILAIAVFATLLLISLQFTPLAYADQQQKKIISGDYFVNTKENIFLKYNDYFIFFKKLYPIEKKATGLQIYLVKNGDLIETTIAKIAYFQDNKWYAKNVTIITKPSDLTWDNSPLIISKKKFIYTLDGFKPKILDNVYSNKKINYSIIDAVLALKLMYTQDIDNTIVRTILYYNIIVPFFVIAAIVLIFLYSSISNRFFNANKFSSLAIALTLSIWGILFFNNKLSMGLVINPELSLIVPIFLLLLYTHYLYNKNKNII